MGFVVVLSLAAIPVGVLISSLRDPTMRRRSRFWLRFCGLVTCMVLPWLAALTGAAGEQGTVTLLLVGLAWALLLVTLAPLLLFHGPGGDSGPSDDGGGGPGPEDDAGGPDRPGGGIPLPDADPPAVRVRGPHTPQRPWHPRRAAPRHAPRPERERERRPSRLRPI